MYFTLYKMHIMNKLSANLGLVILFKFFFNDTLFYYRSEN